MAVVVFDPVRFKLAYPAFAAVSDAFLQSCFTQAGFYLSNRDCSPVQNLADREQLLWMLTAHIAYLQGALNPAGVPGGPQPVGMLSGATEGSVSVSYNFGPIQNREMWYMQSQWGQMFWAATSYLRSFRYRQRQTCIT